MKKLICLCLGLILCGCTGAPTAQNDDGTMSRKRTPKIDKF